MRNATTNFDVWQQYKVYFHRVSVDLKLKHDMTLVPTEKAKNGWGEPNSCYPKLGASVFKLWKDMEIISFDEFIKNEIEDWYWKFKNEIAL